MSNTDKTVKGERLGDYSYTNADLSGVAIAHMIPSIAPDAAFLLAPYKRVAAL